ncbi:MAG: whiA [Clostridia bacterium]|nr:whiA [Clostridia bacterium]
MTFSSKVKNEISKIITEDKCCHLAELSALIKMTGTIQIHGRNSFGIKLSTENASIARMLFTLIKDLFNINTRVAVRKNKQLKKNNNYTLYIDTLTGGETILLATGILSKTEEGIRINYRLPHKLVKKPCCKKAYLRGVFLGGGSISDPEKTYHLELVTNNNEYAESIKKLINSYQLNAKVVNRKGNYVVYLKEGEQIRIVNCETANLSKIVNASMRQINNIELVKHRIGFDNIQEGLAEIAELRLKYPDASLKELGEMMSPPIGKSGVNHRLRKLDEIAEQIKL